MIEKTIQELTAAIRELTTALNSNRPVSQPATVTVGNPVIMYDLAYTKAAEPAASAEPVVHSAPAAPAAPAESAPMEEAAVRASPITQADLRDVASKLLAQKKLPEILRVNREHGIRRITECPESKYESVFNALNAALADAAKS